MNKAPHAAEIGDDLELEFEPEVMGDQFMDACQKLRDTQRLSGVILDDLSGVDRCCAVREGRGTTSWRRSARTPAVRVSVRGDCCGCRTTGTRVTYGPVSSD
ncbi:hypothetical protein ACIQRW_25490 [Streptomyces sp. NPDC091287]|uniref:hypothetical protein n=1 Tax=Streptomyces sp. NPDC091287 TaxID=3365988 RepID=UPI0038003D76